MNFNEPRGQRMFHQDAFAQTLLIHIVSQSLSVIVRVLEIC